MTVKRVEDLAEGDVVGADVVNAQGAVLVKSGVPLVEKHLRLLKMWGVEKLKVDDGTAEEHGGEMEAMLDAAEAEIKARFGPSLDNEVMAEILRVAVEQRAAQMSAKEQT